MNPDQPQPTFDPNRQPTLPPDQPQRPTSYSVPQEQPTAYQPQTSTSYASVPQQPSVISPTSSNSAFGPTTPQRQKKSKTVLLVAGIFVLLLLIGGVIYTILTQKSTTSTTSASDVAQTTQLNMLAQYGSRLQPADISKFDKNELFYAIFKKAAMQPVVGATVDRYLGSSSQDQSSRSNEFIHQSTYNYQTKQIATAISDTQGTYFVRCVDGHYYSYSTVTSSWKMGSAQDDQTTCDAGSYVYSINDGFNTGGLNTSQATTFVSYLKSISGLITVNDIKYVTHDGAPYIRLAITVQPQKFPTGGYTGMGYFLTAFEKTTLDPQKWPYDSFGSIATGAKIVYYIDPAKQLPAYSQIGLTYRLDDTGKQQLPNTVYDFQDTAYTFGGTVPVLPTTGTPQTLKLSWPEEQL